MIIEKMEVQEVKDRIIHSPEDLMNTTLLSFLVEQEKENFVVVCLKGDHTVSSIRTVSVGAVNKCEVHPREIFRCAIVENAVAVIIAHNHPSGNLEPSGADISMTKRIMECGDLLGIQVLDHIIVSRNGYVSLNELDFV